MPRLDDFTPFDPDAPRQGDRTRYPGAEVELLYDRRRCMHAAECGRAHPDVFNARRSPWISPDEGDADAITAIALRCPTGALHAVREGEVVIGAAPPSNEILVSPDGPLFIRGRVFVADSDGGEDAPQARVAICRCGASRNKPYCDNSHTKIRFRDAGGVAEDPGRDAPRGGEVKVMAFEDGPLKVSGDVALRAASGRIASTKSRMFLCRCGNSKNKPFCDGTHNTEGFRSVDEG